MKVRQSKKITIDGRPDPKHWPVMVNKLNDLVSKLYDFTAEKIKAIQSSTLIVVADGDGVLPDHAVEMFRLLRGKYMIDFGPTPATLLAVFPGSSHISMMLQPRPVIVDGATVPG